MIKSVIALQFTRPLSLDFSFSTVLALNTDRLQCVISVRNSNQISSRGHPEDLGDVLCHRSAEGSAGATFLIRLSPHSFRV